MVTGWPSDYADRLSGLSCALCAEGRPEQTDRRIRFWSSDHSDAYLHRAAVQRGFATVIWRGRHVVEPTELNVEEANQFWRDALTVGQALLTCYAPLKMNYQLLGNGAPHLHWLIAPRFREDVAPGQPLPANGYVELNEQQLLSDVAALKEILSGR